MSDVFNILEMKWTNKLILALLLCEDVLLFGFLSNLARYSNVQERLLYVRSHTLVVWECSHNSP